MDPFLKIDFNNHIAAIRAVGIGLGVANANIPSSGASANHMNDLYWINRLRVAMVLPRLPGLDYSGFQAALNVLAALVPVVGP
jgi:hypothetical protein